MQCKFEGTLTLIPEQFVQLIPRLEPQPSAVTIPSARAGITDRPIAQVAPAPYVTVALAATITGLTERAIYRKIQEGKWIEGREFRRSPDGGIFISLKGYQQWVERGSS